MPRLTQTAVNARIRSLVIEQNLWLRCNIEEYDGGGLLDIYRAGKEDYIITIWDTRKETCLSHWIPCNRRRQLYRGFVTGVYGLVHELRKGVMK